MKCQNLFCLKNNKTYLVISFAIFESIPICSDCSIKQIGKKIFLFYHEIVCCMYSLEFPHRGDSNEYTQQPLLSRRLKTIPKVSPFAS